MMLADFQPGLFFLLLWGLISWLTRNKKKKISPDNGEVETKPKSKQDLFSRLQKLQEHFSQDADIFSSVTQPVEEEYIDEEYDDSFIEPDIFVPEQEDLHKNEGNIFTKDDIPLIVEPTNWLKQNLSQKSNLKKLMVIKEILGEPRSLKPYTEDYFQS